MSVWTAILGRHEDGSKHSWEPAPVGIHSCCGYCHHDRLRCQCGASRIVGFSVEEVR